MPYNPAHSVPSPISDTQSRFGFGFTLVELLVVMAIIALLMTLLVPAFSNIGKGSSLAMSGNQVVNLLNLARENSTSRNAMTAVILNTDTAADPNPLTSGAYRTLVVMERLAPEAGATPSPNEWKPVGKWEELRPGVVVSSSNAFTEVKSSNLSSSVLTPALPSFNYRSKPVNLSACKSVVFLPNGSLFSGNTTSIGLVEGVFQGTGSIRTNQGNFYNITIIPSTGRTKIDRP